MPNIGVKNKSLVQKNKSLDPIKQTHYSVLALENGMLESNEVASCVVTCPKGGCGVGRQKR